MGHDDLASIVDAVGASRTHVLLDSCHSFFVVQPRRAGGVVKKRKPLGVELADGRDLGVFLSTSADAQVFEWSKLQSGVFSHAVRSGLFGAADKNGDQKVTYQELESFVARASERIPNIDSRPRVFSVAPDDDVLVDLSRARGRTVELVGFSGTFTVRGPRGVRLLDVDPAPGITPRLVLPEDLSLEVIANLADVDGRRRLFSAEIAREPSETKRDAPIRLSPTLENDVGTPRWRPSGGPR